MINLTKKLQIAEIERGGNPSMMDQCEFFFFAAHGSKDSNIFSKCKRVHVTGCNIMFVDTPEGTVAFVEAKNNG